MIGARLKLARAAAGLSLRDLEERLNHLVTAQALGKYERDEMMPSSTVLIALARALDVTEEYLLNPAEVELVAVEFRKHKLTSVKEDATVRARILSEVERYIEVERILRLDGKAPALPKSPRVSTFDEVEKAAAALRREWNLGDDPIPNLCEVLEERGIKVCAIPLPEKVSGVQAVVSQSDAGKLPVIVVNANHAGERQRFTLAHELGHLYLECKGIDAEAACQRFAGALLMPAHVLRREVGVSRRTLTPRELFDLKLVFGVSAQAIAYRCKDLEIIGPAALASVFKVFNARGWRKNEPLACRKERPARFERLTIRALAEGLISESKASELLNKTIQEVVASMDEPPPAENHGRSPRL
jgi:Zn-dependent peptidase ImmA (M78 family)/transcriptional regulator with XRE-family HTH domain